MEDSNIKKPVSPKLESEVQKMLAKAESLRGKMIELLPEMDEATFQSFEALPPKLQEDIIADISEKKAQDMATEEIVSRSKILIGKGWNLVNMSSRDSKTN